MDHVGPFTFLAARSVLACAFLFPLSWIMEKEKNRFKSKWLDPHLWKTGLLTGFAMFVAAGSQQAGMIYTTAGKAGFLTAMYIVLVPVLGCFLGKRPPLTVWISVAMAVAGLYFLSGAGLDNINIGDILLIFCAFWFAVQITWIDCYGLNLDGVRLNFVQALVCGVLSAAVMLLREDISLPDILNCWLPISYAGILSTGVAFTLQIYGQQLLEPTQASVIMSLESVFALICGWLLLNERLSPMEFLGCCIMFCAVILSQIPKKSPV
jgi:drug/metabolite transporter (DMT)-like permease